MISQFSKNEHGVVSVRFIGTPETLKPVFDKMIENHMTPCNLGWHVVSYDLKKIRNSKAISVIQSTKANFERIFGLSELPLSVYENEINEQIEPVINAEAFEKLSSDGKLYDPEYSSAFIKNGKLCCGIFMRKVQSKLVMSGIKMDEGFDLDNVFPFLLVKCIFLSSELNDVDEIVIQSQSAGINGLNKIFGEPRAKVDFHEYAIRVFSEEEEKKVIDAVNACNRNSAPSDPEVMVERYISFSPALRNALPYIGDWFKSVDLLAGPRIPGLVEFCNDYKMDFDEVIRYIYHSSGTLDRRIEVNDLLIFDKPDLEKRSPSKKIRLDEVIIGRIDNNEKDIWESVFAGFNRLRNFYEYIALGAVTPDRELIGVLLMRKNRMYSKMMEIAYLKVNSAYEKSGVGKKLLDTAFEVIENSSMEYMFIKWWNRKERCERLEEYLKSVKMPDLVSNGQIIKFTPENLKQSVFFKKIMASADRLPEVSALKYSEFSRYKEFIESRPEMFLPGLYDQKYSSVYIKDGQIKAVLAAHQIGPKAVYVRDYYLMDEEENYLLPALLARTLKTVTENMPDDATISFKLFEQEKIDALKTLFGESSETYILQMLFSLNQPYSRSVTELSRLPVLSDLQYEDLYKDIINFEMRLEERYDVFRIFGEELLSPLSGLPGVEFEDRIGGELNGSF